MAYFIIKLGRRIIWDQTGKNKDILKRGEFGRKYAEDIMCDKRR